MTIMTSISASVGTSSPTINTIIIAATVVMLLSPLIVMFVVIVVAVVLLLLLLIIILLLLLLSHALESGRQRGFLLMLRSAWSTSASSSASAASVGQVASTSWRMLKVSSTRMIFPAI